MAKQLLRIAAGVADFHLYLQVCIAVVGATLGTQVDSSTAADAYCERGVLWHSRHCVLYRVGCG